MKKNFKRIAIASLLVIILVISVASVAMASGPNLEPGTCNNPDAGTCPNPDCPNPDCPNDGVCINSDGICDGDELKYQHQNGQCQANGTGYKYQYRSCQVE